MKTKEKKKLQKRFESFASKITRITGSATAFITAISIIILWGVCGPIFHFSDTWQLVVNTGTTIITFLMVFVIQHSQNKDTAAMHIKLNELLASNEKASNRVVSVEDLTEEELEVLKKFYSHLVNLAKKNNDLFSTHSIDEEKEKTKK